MTLIICEIGLNHKGDISLAKEMIGDAKDAGASIVKFQMFDKSDYKDDAINKCWFSNEQLRETKEYADKIGIEWFCTPETIKHVNFLEKIGVKRYKVGHNHSDDKQLIDAIALTRKPVIISYYPESGKSLYKPKMPLDYSVLYCVGKYPPRIKDFNLKRVKSFDGFSSHYHNILPCLIALSLGAKILEVHVKKVDDCVDSNVSISFTELSKLVRYAKQIGEML